MPRVYEVAREFGVSPEEVLGLLDRVGIPTLTQLSEVDAPTVEHLRALLRARNGDPAPRSGSEPHSGDPPATAAPPADTAPTPRPVRADTRAGPTEPGPEDRGAAPPVGPSAGLGSTWPRRVDTLADTLSVLRGGLVWIVLACLLGLGAALAVSLTATPVYESEVRVLLHPLPAADGTSTASVNTANELEVLRGDATAREVSAALGSTISPEHLQANVDASNPDDTDILVITYTDTDRATARQVAATYAEVYLRLRVDAAEAVLGRARSEIEQQLAVLQGRLADLAARIPQAADDTERTQLLAESTFLQTRLVERELALIGVSHAPDVGTVIQDATLPVDPVRPTPLRDGLLGLLIGLGAGVGAVLARDRILDPIRDRTTLEQLVGAPVLGVIPRIRRLRRRRGRYLVSDDRPGSAAYEAFRATALELAAGIAPGRPLLVTAPTSGEGTSTVTVNLGILLARMGARTVLVSGDLRRPDLERWLGLEPRPGLAEALTDGGTTTLRRPTGIPNLELVHAGRGDGAAAERLGSARCEELLREISTDADVVLIDTPAVTDHADALALAHLVGQVLLVVGPRSLSAGILSKVAADLGRIAARPVGVVLVRTPVRR